MLIRFLKPHINWKPNDEVNVDTTQGNYLIRMRVAEPVDANPVKTEETLLNHLEENKEIPADDVSDEDINEDDETVDSSEPDPETSNDEVESTEPTAKTKKTAKKSAKKNKPA